MHANKPFLHTPYESGVSLREDIFHRQFIVNASGRMAYPEDDPIYGTYTCEEDITVCEASTISGAISLLLQVYHSDRWPIRDENVDYYDDELGHDCGPIDFYPHMVKIFDRHHRLVLGGNFKSQEDINWFCPVTDMLSIADIKAKQRKLSDQAAEESGWDNFETARSLWRERDYLSLHLVHNKYASLPEIKQFASHELNL
ncbi:hypothetical protein BH012_09985 [Salmonella enterica]|nr:hypothetical protein [Salmonella enterica]EAX6601651.1 hypothetical protein [Salmonella enterica]